MKSSRKWILAALVAAGVLTAGCSGQPSAQQQVAVQQGAEAEKNSSAAGENGQGQTGSQDGSGGQVAEEGETIPQEEVVTADMHPIYGNELKDGTYEVKVDSSSGMFRITDCVLTVEDGEMRAVMTMSGTGYLKLYMGTGEEAVKTSEDAYIPYFETESGAYAFEIPVEALDAGIACSAFSKNKEKWYDRTLVFRADSLPTEAFAESRLVTAESLGLEDGIYTAEVVLEGGSGRASVESPAKLRIEDGQVFATIVWGSANYDYMKVDGEIYEWSGEGEHSTFEIPVAGFDWKLSVIADTVAMSVPHEIEYTLTFDSKSLKKQTDGADSEEADWDISQVDHSMELQYAEQFSVDYYKNGAALITIQDSGKYLVLPEKCREPQNLPGDIAVIRQPLKNIYLAATSAMDLFCSIDGLEAVTLSGTEASGWYIEEARQAMEAGHMVYAGKYSAPDYEQILAMNCDLAIESTMIYHSPAVKEQLERLGIPVLVERSSYESHPLGRMEWLRLYGVLLDREEQADRCLAAQWEQLAPILDQKATGKTAAFFYITSHGSANVRKSGDYVAKMIGLAGGTYVPQNLNEDENAFSTMNMQMEAFYAAAKDADYIIYNSAIDGELKTLDELLEKSGLLADFKAVKEGHVWCTGKNMFQETMGLGDMILDIHRILTEDEPRAEEMTYLHRLQ